MYHYVHNAVYRIGCVILTGILITGCEFSGPGAGKTLSPEEQKALIEEWKILAQGGLDPMNLAAGEELTGRLARSGAAQLLPLLDLLGDANADPTAKVFATSCLMPFVTVELQDLIIALTAPEQEATTRACAVRLLGRVPTPETTERLWALVEDAESRVSFEAHMMLVLHGEKAIQKHFPALWRDGNLSNEQRTQWVLMLPEEYASSCMPVLREALSDVALELPARQQALKFLIREGREESDLAVLRSILEKEPDTILARDVEEGLPMLEQRIAEGAISTTVQKEQ